MSTRIDGVIKFARSAFRNDGAEGETVHALCDEVERLTAALADKALVLERYAALRDELAQVKTGAAIARADRAEARGLVDRLLSTRPGGPVEGVEREAILAVAFEALARWNSKTGGGS